MSTYFIGDTQRTYDETEAFVHHANGRDDIDFVIHGGDYTEFGRALRVLSPAFPSAPLLPPCAYALLLHQGAISGWPSVLRLPQHRKAQLPVVHDHPRGLQL